LAKNVLSPSCGGSLQLHSGPEFPPTFPRCTLRPDHFVSVKFVLLPNNSRTTRPPKCPSPRWKVNSITLPTSLLRRARADRSGKCATSTVESDIHCISTSTGRDNSHPVGTWYPPLPQSTAMVGDFSESPLRHGNCVPHLGSTPTGTAAQKHL